MADFRLFQCLLIKNRWYNTAQRIQPAGIVVHSSGANNPQLRRYVNPAVGQTFGMGTVLPEAKSLSYYELLSVLGTNQYANDWNRTTEPYGMHAFVGKLADGSVAAVQTLPWDRFLHGCGSGRNGSYNSTHIQFEICEDTTNAVYTQASYEAAAILCAHLCKAYNLPVSSIRGHFEAHQDGYASAHADPEHWWVRYGFSMDSFREEVEKRMADEGYEPEKSEAEQIVEKAAAYLGLDSPDYWLDVVESRTAASAQNVEALLKKFIAKIESMT